MAISDLHASTTVKGEAGFGFSDFSCSPAEITARSGIEPDEVLRKGDLRPTRGNRDFVVPFSSWSISSRCQSKDVNDHLRGLLVKLENAEVPFPPEWGEPSFDVLWVGNYLYAGSGPFHEADVRSGMAAHGAALYQDIYQVDQDENEMQGESGLRRIPRPD